MRRLLSACSLFVVVVVVAVANAAPLKEELPAGAIARLGSAVVPSKDSPATGSVNALVFLNDKTLFVGANGGWSTWDLEKRRMLQEKPIGGPAFTAARDSQRLFIGSARKLHLIEPVASSTIEPAQSWNATSDEVGVLAVSPGGRRVVFSDGEQKLAILDGKSGKTIGSLQLTSKPVAASLTANGRLLAIVTRDGAARIYNLDADCKLDLAFTKRVARSDRVAAAFSPDGRLFAVSSAGRVTILDSAAGRVMQSLERRFGEGDVRCLAFSPDGRQIVVGRNGPDSVVRVYETVVGLDRADVEAYFGRANFAGHLGDVNAVAFSPDGKTLASAGSDTSVLVWKVPERGPKLKAMTATEAWESLDTLEADMAYRCTEQLLEDRAKTIEFLRERIGALPAEHAQIQRWIRELDHDEFRIREAAKRGLTKAGLRAAAALVDPKRKALGAEGEQRVRLILESFESQGLRMPEGGLFGEPLRMVRAVRVLEIIGTKEARRVLEEAVKGAADSRLSREAKMALEAWREEK
jgi:hypothetical protein